jgi:hypothetical protein
MPMAPPKSMYPYPPPNQRNGVGGYSYDGEGMNQGRGNDAVQIGTTEMVTDKLSKIQIGGVENHNDDVSTEQIK